MSVRRRLVDEFARLHEAIGSRRARPIVCLRQRKVVTGRFRRGGNVVGVDAFPEGGTFQIRSAIERCRVKSGNLGMAAAICLMDKD